MLQPLLASQRIADGCVQSCSQFDYLFARVSTPIAAKDRDRAGPLIMSVSRRGQNLMDENTGAAGMLMWTGSPTASAAATSPGIERTVGPFSRIEVRIAVPMTA